jgi:uncharacterized protein YigA (DUF484 family)
MQYQVSIQKNKEKEFLQMIHVLTELGVVNHVEKIETHSAQSNIPKREDFEEISEEFTADLALSEFESRYRDLVD